MLTNALRITCYTDYLQYSGYFCSSLHVMQALIYDLELFMDFIVLYGVDRDMVPMVTVLDPQSRREIDSLVIYNMS